jgi:hypothetical protein
MSQNKQVETPCSSEFSFQLFDICPEISIHLEFGIYEVPIPALDLLTVTSHSFCCLLQACGNGGSTGVTIALHEIACIAGTSDGGIEVAGVKSTVKSGTGTGIGSGVGSGVVSRVGSGVGSGEGSGVGWLSLMRHLWLSSDLMSWILLLSL